MNNRIIDILTLELKSGCNDKAVNGGLNNFLANLAQSESPKSPIIQVVAMLPLEGYSSLGQEEREQWLNNAINLLVSSEKFRQGKVQKPKRKDRVTAAPAPIVDSIETEIKNAQLGIRTSTINSLEKLGINTIKDALYFFPYRYTDFSETVLINELESGAYQTIQGNVIRSKIIRMGRGGRLKATEIIVKDTANATIRVVWFNQVFIAKYIKAGNQIALSGKVKVYKGQFTFDNPEYEIINNTQGYEGKILPTYHLTKGLAQKTIKNFSAKVINKYIQLMPETLPDVIKKKYSYPNLSSAIQVMHYPKKMNDVYEARQRIAFDELLGIQIAVMKKKSEAAKLESSINLTDTKIVDQFIEHLPFELTHAQRNAINVLMQDLQQTSPMARLLEGDVGSGKTVVALSAMLAMIGNGYQAVIMAPTEILAEQHYKSIIQLLTGQDELALFGVISHLDIPIRLTLLTGSMASKEKKYSLELIENGSANIVIGTHALIQESVNFHNLGMIVIDEQHRFGVMQRAQLKNKSEVKDINPHTLVMTATPIPRSLALTVFGDLDLTIIDEMPAGRQPISTNLLNGKKEEKAFSKVKTEIAKGNQAFIICPLVEESEKIDHKAVMTEHKRLQEEIFTDAPERVGLLHGKMKGKDKEIIMKNFKEKKLDILVATSVIEVGIDIPDATVIVIEGADRFGLAQLHQLRGRVGRSNKKSYCYLIAEEPNEDAELRLRTFADISDGFELAEADLQIRGPGEIYGTRQSGLPNIRIASLLDARLIDRAKNEAMDIIENKYQFSDEDQKKINQLSNILNTNPVHELH